MTNISKTFVGWFTNKGIPAVGLSPLPTITIWEVDSGAKVVDAEDTVEIDGGWYKYVFPMFNTTKSYVATWDVPGGQLRPGEAAFFGATVCDTAQTIAAEVWAALLADIFGTVGSAGEAMSLMLGLVQNNFQLDNTSFDNNGLMIGGRIRIWDSAANVGSTTGVLATWIIVATPHPSIPGVASDYTVTRQ